MNDVSRSFRGNSNAARDIAHHLHPYTNFKKHEETGPLTIVRGHGIYVIDDDGKRYIEGLAGLWCTALGFSDKRLAEAAYGRWRSCPTIHTFDHRSHDPLIELAEKLMPIAPAPIAEGLLRQLRLRGDRHRDQADLVLQQRARPAGEEEDHRAPARLSRHHRGRGQPDRPAAHATGFDLPMLGVRTPHARTIYRVRLPRRDRGRSSSTGWPRSSRTLIVAEGPDTVAAFFAEPVQGAGGVIVPPAGYFAKIQPILQASTTSCSSPTR